MVSMKCMLVAVTLLAASSSIAMAKEEPASVAAETKAAKPGAEPKSGKGGTAKGGSAPKPVKEDPDKIGGAVKVIQEIAAIQKRKIPPVLLNGASGVVIIPKAPKQNFMVSGGSAGGVLLAKNDNGTWSNPVWVNISGGTLGWQIVADPMDIVLVIKSKKNVEAILKGKLALDARVGIEPGHLGPTMKGASADQQKAEIASYVRSRGAFVDEAAVAGNTIQLNAAANSSLYGKEATAEGIASGTAKPAKSAEEIKALQDLLASYAAAK